jgi:hypothetical protein
MSSQIIFKTAGATSKHCDVQLEQKASGSPGDPITGLAFNTASFTCYYRVGATGTLTAITLATQTVGGAWSSGGFVEISSTNAPGGYRFDIPNAVIATAGESNIWFNGATNLRAHQLKIIVTGVDLYDAVRGGMTSLQNLARVDGTAQAGTSTTLTLASNTTALQAPLGGVIVIVSGTGAGEALKIAGLTGGGTGTPIATMSDTWITTPDNTSVYQIFPDDGIVPALPSAVWTQSTRTLTGPIVGGRIDCNVGSVANVVVQQHGTGTQMIGGP